MRLNATLIEWIFEGLLLGTLTGLIMVTLFLTDRQSNDINLLQQRVDLQRTCIETLEDDVHVLNSWRITNEHNALYRALDTTSNLWHIIEVRDYK